MKNIIILLTCLCFSLASYAENSTVAFETSKGTITIQLFDDEAPETVKNFLQYVESGFYDGTIFHRIIPDFVIQGGGHTKDLARKETRDPIKNEAKESLKNKRGTLSMARLSDPHSATSQFFINLKDNDKLDYKPYNVGYAVFGEVSPESLKVIEKIARVETGSQGVYKDVPLEPVEIFRAYKVQ